MRTSICIWGGYFVLVWNLDKEERDHESTTNIVDI